MKKIKKFFNKEKVIIIRLLVSKIISIVKLIKSKKIIIDQKEELNYINELKELSKFNFKNILIELKNHKNSELLKSSI